MVRGGDKNRSIRAFRADVIGGVGNTRRRITPYGFCQDLIGEKLRQLPKRLLYIYFVCDYQDILFWDELTHPSEGLLQERLARSKKIEELLWFVFTANGPKAAPYTAAHNNAIEFAIHRNLLCLFYVAQR